jgi:hypothetical protein
LPNSTELAEFQARCETSGFSTPIALFVYNRPKELSKVLAAIRLVRPRLLLIVADGPKPDVPGDEQRCRDVAEILGDIDWPCDVEWNHSPVNLGCRVRPQSGLNWVFQRTEAAVILEDDCVADISFFAFCEAMLDRYRDDPAVLAISGYNLQLEPAPCSESYYFSRYPLVGAWAGWRRSWAVYDANIDAWPALRETGWLDSVLNEKLAARYWRAIFDRVRDGSDAWDYQLTFTLWRQGGLAIHPGINLIRNIGYGPDATHTKDDRIILVTMPMGTMQFPLRHPEQVERNAEADSIIETTVFSGTPGRLLRILRAAVTEKHAVGGGQNFI